MTIYDIAREAGVAASTVSRVINNKPGIRAETRQRVEELLKKYHFTPDAAARGLVMQSTRMVGILIEDIRVVHHVNSAFVIEQELTRRGYCCIIMGTGQEEERKAEYIQILEQRRVEGVILMGSMFGTEKVKKSIQKYLRGIPVVIVNGYLDLPNVSGVLVDEDRGVQRCVELLAGKGRERIAFVLDTPSPANSRKQQGYCDGIRQTGANGGEPWIYAVEEASVKGGYDVTVRILKERPQIQGIIYSVDRIAVGGIRAAYDQGRRVPEDLALVGVDNTVYGEICMPKLTTLDNKLQELSEAAADMLREGLEGNIQNRLQEMCSEIIEREST